MTRDEHLAWAKERALEYLDAGDPTQAVTSMLSDLGKHDELRDHAGMLLGGMLMLSGRMNTDHEVREFITGFN